MRQHLVALRWVEHYTAQLAYEMRERPWEARYTRQSLRYWQSRLDAIECPQR